MLIICELCMCQNVTYAAGQLNQSSIFLDFYFVSFFLWQAYDMYDESTLSSNSVTRYLSSN